jgi:hypothetical protein
MNKSPKARHFRARRAKVFPSTADKLKDAIPPSLDWVLEAKGANRGLNLARIAIFSRPEKSRFSEAEPSHTSPRVTRSTEVRNTGS